MGIESFRQKNEKKLRVGKGQERDGWPSFVESNSTYTKGPSMQPSWGGFGASKSGAGGALSALQILTVQAFNSET